MRHFFYDEMKGEEKGTDGCKGDEMMVSTKKNVGGEALISFYIC
jgi:hypothetical protein